MVYEEEVKKIKSLPNTHGVQKVVAKNPKRHAEKMQNQNGWLRPPAADVIKIFDNDDQAAKHNLPANCLMAFYRFLATTAFAPWEF